jgi:hypothetical protein
MKPITALFFVLLTLQSGLVEAGMETLLFSKAVPKAHKLQILKDLEILKSLNLEEDESSAQTKHLLGLDNLSVHTMEDWLSERVKVIIDEKAFSFLNFSFNKSISIERENVNYPNLLQGQKEIEKEKSLEASEEDEEAYTVMTNIGSGLYLTGKKEKRLYRMKVSTGIFKSQTITIDSPRVGIIQIGQGLFDSRFNINNSNPNAISNSLHRLGVLFHEARHSDGNGESLAFAHVICPKGHDYEGYMACDSVPNGAYAINAAVIKEFIKACQDDCTEREREILLLTALDAENRVLKKTYKDLSPRLYNSLPEFIQ